MRWVLALVLGATLAGCGADGEPVQPTRNATISVTPNGVAASGQVGARQGPVSVTFGLGL
jgi:hypothetical protein